MVNRKETSQAIQTRIWFRLVQPYMTSQLNLSWIFVLKLKVGSMYTDKLFYIYFLLKVCTKCNNAYNKCRKILIIM